MSNGSARSKTSHDGHLGDLFIKRHRHASRAAARSTTARAIPVAAAAFTDRSEVYGSAPSKAPRRSPSDRRRLRLVVAVVDPRARLARWPVATLMRGMSRGRGLLYSAIGLIVRL
jgi:hypothetical protein